MVNPSLNQQKYNTIAWWSKKKTTINFDFLQKQNKINLHVLYLKFLKIWSIFLKPFVNKKITETKPRKDTATDSYNILLHTNSKIDLGNVLNDTNLHRILHILPTSSKLRHHAEIISTGHRDDPHTKFSSCYKN